MEIERIEDWIGREVVDAEGSRIGKLDEVYFDGDRPVIGEVKPGLLSRKRVLVPLEGVSLTRDCVRVTGRITDDAATTGFESSSTRAKRLADVAEAEERARAADAEAARRAVDAEDAAKQAREAQEAAAAAEEARKVAEARVERVKQRGPGETAS